MLLCLYRYPSIVVVLVLFLFKHIHPNFSFVFAVIDILVEKYDMNGQCRIFKDKYSPQFVFAVIPHVATHSKGQHFSRKILKYEMKDSLRF